MRHEEELDAKSLISYHGTTDLFDLSNGRRSAAETGNLREDWRKILQEKVFVTTSLLSACKYAKKAAQKYGGNPAVYRVQPDLGSIEHRMDAEYITDFADVVDKLSF